MTLLETTPSPPSEAPPSKPPNVKDSSPKNKRRGNWLNILVAAIAFTGLLLASYPSIAQWVTSVQRANTITGYERDMESINSADREALLEAARAYNAAMPEVLLTDPYSRKEAGEGRGGAWEEYLKQLHIPGSDVMGRISIPSIDTNIAIFHGTDDDTLMRGAGHLFGSSLPVGGESTHSVITGHTALTEAKLFDDLNKVQEGDEFFITVAGERIAYRVDQIKVVLPAEIGDLKIVDGKDYVTLVTCAPPTVNTHRLLIRGERVPIESAELKDAAVIDHTTIGFPWWMLWVVGGSILIAGLTIWVLRPDIVQRLVARVNGALPGRLPSRSSF